MTDNEIEGPLLLAGNKPNWDAFNNWRSPMRELKSYQDPYLIKKTPAFYGPYKRKINWDKIFTILFACALGFAGAVVLFYQLSKG